MKDVSRDNEKNLLTGKVEKKRHDDQYIREEPTMRYEIDEGTRSSTIDRTEPSTRPWNMLEQTSLENALRKYPASLADRWDKISLEVPNRTKTECIMRFKVL